MPSTAMPTITIVAKTGWVIEVRVIHMAYSPSRQPGRVVDGASVDLTSTGAPSRRLSKRAASTGRLGGSADLTSTTPLSASRRPTTITRLTSLPASIAHTYVRPASLRTAAAGSVVTGA